MASHGTDIYLFGNARLFYKNSSKKETILQIYAYKYTVEQRIQHDTIYTKKAWNIEIMLLNKQ